MSGIIGPPGGPPPLPPIQGLVPRGMRPIGINATSEQMLAFLLPPKRDEERQREDSDASLPPTLRKYAAGLRPSARPTAAPWQQEIVFERLSKTDEEIAQTARFWFSACRNYDDQLSRQRITASEYYAGEPNAPRLEGRSNITLTVVRDTIRQTLPSLLRLFTGVEDPVSFAPVSSEETDGAAAALARQATDYARWALFSANAGWQILHDALLDALTRKAGWVRWHWGAKQASRTEVCEGLLLPQLQMLLAEPGIEASRIIRRPLLQAEQAALMKTPEGQMYLSQGAAPELWSATLTRSTSRGWPHISQRPAECIWVDPGAGTVESAKALWDVRDVTVSELLEMGLPEDKVLAHRGRGTDMRRRQEVLARDGARGRNMAGSPPNDKATSLVRYAEGWVRMDTDGDNRSELIHVHMLGNAQSLIQWERVDEIPLACFTPYREPGQVVGLSQADMVMDLQRIESRVMRHTLDSLAQSMFPRTVAVQGQVNMADVRQTAIGSIIRAANVGAVTELVKPFGGKEALPVMAVLESIRESRTGITRASAGLTVDELQSTAPIAVSQQSSAAQDRLDMVARTLAETGLAPLYSGLLRMLARQQDRPNVIRIRNEWVAIDPRALSTDWECAVNVGGKGMPSERLQMLSAIAQKQELIMQVGGMGNPLAGIPEYRNTLARMLETVNVSDVSQYFRALPPNFQPPPTPPPPPDPSLILAQVQQAKTAADVENDRADQQTKRASLLLEDDRDRDKAALDAWVKTWVAAAQFGTPAPSLDQFKASMKSNAPAVGLLSDLPSPSSSQPPAVGQPPPAPRPGGPGQPFMSPQMAGPRPPQGGGMPPPRPMAPPPVPQDPMTRAAIGNALATGRMPTAYGQIAQRAALSPLLGPGGPPLPGPGGQQ